MTDQGDMLSDPTDSVGFMGQLSISNFLFSYAKRPREAVGQGVWKGLGFVGGQAAGVGEGVGW